MWNVKFSWSWTWNKKILAKSCTLRMNETRWQMLRHDTLTIHNQKLHFPTWNWLEKWYEVYSCVEGLLDILKAYVNHRKHLYFTFKTYMEPISFDLKVSPYIFVIAFIVFLKGRIADTLRHPKKTE